MPALRRGLAMLKWITLVPAAIRRAGCRRSWARLLSDAATGEPLALLDARAVTALRTGAVAAVAAQALAREDARAAGIVGCGLHGAWAARCLAAAGYGPGVCFDPRRRRRRARSPASSAGRPGALDGGAGLRRRLLRHAGPRARGRARATCVPGMHLNMLGADGPGKAEATVARSSPRAPLFCDEWEQASHGGELTGAVEAGLRHARARSPSSAPCSPATRRGRPDRTRR